LLLQGVIAAWAAIQEFLDQIVVTHAFQAPPSKQPLNAAANKRGFCCVARTGFVIAS